MLAESIVTAVKEGIDRDRLVERATELVRVPSPTRNAGPVADRFAAILTSDGFEVERVDADWPESPAVVTRLDSGRAGRTLQFNGHLDTVHLPFVEPSVRDDILRGSGASDMKGGVAAFVEAMCVLRETAVLDAGSVLMTAHDHHEGPWGDKRQLKALIRDGYVGDAVLLPEYLAGVLPLRGRGMGIFRVVVTCLGEPIHEVLRPTDLPNVVAAAARITDRLYQLAEDLKARSPGPGVDTVFVGQLEAGEIYNQAPVEAQLAGTRRWTIPGSGDEAIEEVESIVEDAAQSYGVSVSFTATRQGEAFEIDEGDAFVEAFQTAHTASTGRALPVGEKPFLDDGNLFLARAGIPAITHGPDAHGAHTMDEWVPVDELVRVAEVYALTAISFCGEA
jgi:succinyl-diaminopimelate desuccinylase